MIIKLPNPLSWLKGKQEIPDLTQAGKFDHLLTPDASEEPSTAAKAVESDMSVKSFFSSLKADIVAMWKKAPAEEVALASAVNATVPFIEGLDTIITPELAPILNPILDKVKVGLSALKTTIQGAGTSASIPSIVASVNANLTALVSAAQVKDPATATKIQEVAAIVTAAVTEIGASTPATA